MTICQQNGLFVGIHLFTGDNLLLFSTRYTKVIIPSKRSGECNHLIIRKLSKIFTKKATVALVCGTAFANREVNLNFKKLKDLKELGFRNKLIIKK